MQDQIKAMKQWCIDHYEQGADTMVECWGTQDYADLFVDHEGKPVTHEQAWTSLKQLADIYQDQQADAINSAF